MEALKEDQEEVENETEDKVEPDQGTKRPALQRSFSPGSDSKMAPGSPRTEPGSRSRSPQAKDPPGSASASSAQSKDGRNASLLHGGRFGGHLEATLHRMEAQLAALEVVPDALGYLCEMPRQLSTVLLQLTCMQAHLAEIEKHYEMEEPPSRRHTHDRHAHDRHGHDRHAHKHPIHRTFSPPPNRKGRSSIFHHGMSHAPRHGVSLKADVRPELHLPPMMEHESPTSLANSPLAGQAIDFGEQRSMLDDSQGVNSDGLGSQYMHITTEPAHSTHYRRAHESRGGNKLSVLSSTNIARTSAQGGTPDASDNNRGSTLRSRLESLLGFDSIGANFDERASWNTSAPSSPSTTAHHTATHTAISTPRMASTRNSNTATEEKSCVGATLDVVPSSPSAPPAAISFNLADDGTDAGSLPIPGQLAATVEEPTDGDGSGPIAGMGDAVHAEAKVSDHCHGFHLSEEIPPLDVGDHGFGEGALPQVGAFSKESTRSFNITRLTLPRAHTKRGTAIFSLASQTISMHRQRGFNRIIPSETTWILKPNSACRLVWDAFAILCTVFTGVVVPLQLVYFDDRSMSPTVITMLYLVDCVWPIDIVLNLVTGYYAKGKMVSDKLSIALAYAKHWMLPDLIASWPLFVCRPVGSKSFVVVALLKLYRLIQIGRRVGNIRAEYQELRLMSVNIAIVIFFIIHINSALWRLAMRADGNEDVGDNWYDLYVADQYWVLMTMTTIGYGDISPSGTLSRLYAMAVMFIASAMFGSIVSLFTHITSALFNDTTEQRVEEVTRFMRRRQVNRDLQRRVQYNLRRNLRYQMNTTMDPDLLTLLSPAMQRELSLALLGNTVHKFPLFKGAQRSFVAEMAQAHTWEQVLPGDLVAEEGHLITEIVFVMLGCLQASIGTDSPQTSSIPRQTAAPQAIPGGLNGRRMGAACLTGNDQEEYEIRTGAWFGEACFFDANRIYTATIVALTECELAALSANDYMRIVQKYPRLWERHQAIEKSIASGALSLKDLAYKESPKAPGTDEQKKPKPSFVMRVVHRTRTASFSNAGQPEGGNGKVLRKLGAADGPDLTVSIANRGSRQSRQSHPSLLE